MQAAEKHRFRQVILVLMFIAAFALAFATFSLMRDSAKMLGDVSGNRLLSLSRYATELTTPEELEQYREPEDMYLPEYLALKARLIDFVDEHELLYVYYVRYYPEENQIGYIIDNTPVDFTALELDHFGTDPYTERVIFDHENTLMMLGDYYDGYSGYYSAFCPMFYEDGTFANVFAGVDMSDESIVRADANSFWMGALLLAALVLLAVIGVWSILAYRNHAYHAEIASKSKTAFLTNMSHEIRTPLNAIIGMSELARREQDAHVREDYLLKLEDSSRHLLGVINDIIDVSKIEAGKMELHLDDASLHDILRRTEELCAYHLSAKGQRFLLEVADDTPLYFSTDEQRLVQALTNLIANAVKFTPEEGSITLDIKAADISGNQATLAFSVTDTGIGMSKEQQDRLFAPFMQADSSISGRYGGTGLGLSISKSIVESLGGSISVCSEMGKGSCFFFTLPVTLVQAPALSAEVPIDETQLDFSTKRILLVEDIEINREIVKALLAETRVHIETAENGRLAVERISAGEAFDVILMDIQMPEMNGYDAARAIRALQSDYAKGIPMIAMTADVFRKDIDACLEAGMNDHLPKPVESKALLQKLAQYLSAPVHE